MLDRTEKAIAEAKTLREVLDQLIIVNKNEGLLKLKPSVADVRRIINEFEKWMSRGKHAPEYSERLASIIDQIRKRCVDLTPASEIYPKIGANL